MDEKVATQIQGKRSASTDLSQHGGGGTNEGGERKLHLFSQDWAKRGGVKTRGGGARDSLRTHPSK